MKIPTGLFILLLSSATVLQVQACDEACRKQSAAKKSGVEFSSYLSRKYCKNIAMEFMTTTISSLQSYRSKHLRDKHRGGMSNTRKFIEQRKEWLEECDQYLSLTQHGRIFKNSKTTENILNAMDSVSQELSALVNGVTYTSQPGNDSTSVAGEKFDRLFELVDQHKTRLQLRGQFVIR
ncbi:MAG: hypothetical protein P8Y45_21720 [Exilibacterium sp.]